MAYKVDVYLSTIDRYLQGCYATENTPRVSELAKILGTSRESLSRRFAGATGLSLAGYMKERQLEYAKALLSTSALTTQNIAYGAGFGTRRTFFRAFLRATGVSPACYRRSHNVSSRTSVADE